MKIKATFSALSLLLASQTYAQSSVTISGTLDAGVSYVSNEGGGHALKFDDGIAVPNLLTFSGKEDLGGGTHTVFTLTNQFDMGTGSFITGGSLFSNAAFVGLDDDRYGRLTLGNQYDFMTDSLFFGLDDASIYTQGVYDFRNGPFTKLGLPDNPTGAFNWDRMGGVGVNNSLKYQSVNFGGFSAGVMCGLGGVAGSFGSNNATSAGVNYTHGAFGADSAYTVVKSAVSGRQDSVRNWGVGAHYKIGSVTTSALYTAVRNELNGAGVWQAELGGMWQIEPEWSLSGAYMYMKGNDVVENNHAHQLTAMLNYQLSKRTGVYVASVYQRANQGANAQVNGALIESSGTSQLVARIGMQTRF
jgi:predicted porin